MSNKINSHFPEAYTDRLLERYDPDIVHQLASEWRYANLPNQPGETVPYVRLQQGAGEWPLMYVPGFSEGIINKASFAAELNTHNFDVILPGQNRKGILRDAATNKKSAAYSQAVNCLAVLEAEGIESPADFISHSYGSLVLGVMAKVAEVRKLPYFNDARVVMLAPAGFNEDESVGSLLCRWTAMLKSEMKQSNQDFPDIHGVTGRASAKTLLANIPRTLRESYHDLVRERIDVEQLFSAGVARLAIVSYAEDAMFPYEVLEKGVMKALAAGANRNHPVPTTWSVPISFQKANGSPRPYSGSGAVHDDEQLNPSRVASAVADILRN